MPHCVLWHPSDWRFAIETALLVALLHEGGTTASMAAEVRNRERVMGVTCDARRGQRIRYVDAGDREDPLRPDGPDVLRLSEYRDL